MAFKMKGSPAKRGVIQGTESALKARWLWKTVSKFFKKAPKKTKFVEPTTDPKVQKLMDKFIEGIKNPVKPKLKKPIGGGPGEKL